MSDLTRRTFLAGAATLPIVAAVPLHASAEPTLDDVVEGVAAYPYGLLEITEQHLWRSRELFTKHRDILRAARVEARAAGFDVERQGQAVAWAGFQHRKLIFREIQLPMERREDWPTLPEMARRIAESGRQGFRNAPPARHQLTNPWA